MVSPHNHSDAVQEIADGERNSPAGYHLPFLRAEFTETDELSDTVRERAASALREAEHLCLYPIGLFADDSRRMSLALKLRPVFGVLPFALPQKRFSRCRGYVLVHKVNCGKAKAQNIRGGMLSIPIYFIFRTKIPFRKRNALPHERQIVISADERVGREPR